MGKLERKLDTDLVARMATGWRAKDKIIPLKRVSEPRKAETYRAARRNAMKPALLSRGGE